MARYVAWKPELAVIVVVASGVLKRLTPVRAVTATVGSDAGAFAVSRCCALAADAPASTSVAAALETSANG